MKLNVQLPSEGPSRNSTVSPEVFSRLPSDRFYKARTASSRLEGVQQNTYCTFPYLEQRVLATLAAVAVQASG